jgi:hypothetical protein
LLEAEMIDLPIRDCQLEDVAAVLELWKQVDATPSVTDTTDDLRLAIADSPAHFLVAEAAGQIVGSIIGTFDGWRATSIGWSCIPATAEEGSAAGW